MIRLFVVILCFSFLFLACKKEQGTNQKIQRTHKSDQLENKAVKRKDSMYVSQSTDPQTANNLKTFLVHHFLKDELDYLQPIDRKFQFYKIDLNKDGKDEIFVRFMSPYFCGTGGCTFLLLDKYGEIITRFSVTRAPIFVEPTNETGWPVILVKDAGVFKELRFDKGTYPSNPSMLPKAPYDTPSGHAVVLFDDDNYPSKTFEF